MKLLDRYIDWIVVLEVGFWGYFILFQSVLQIFWGDATTIFNIFKFVLLFFVVLYQRTHFGLRFLRKSFVAFFLLYSIFVFGEIFVIGDESMISPTESFPLPIFFMKSLLIIILFLCAETVIENFNCLKFIILSLFLVVLPAIEYINIFGTEVLQEARLQEGDKDQLGVLALGYSGSIVFVLSCLTANKMLKISVIGSIFSFFVAFISAYLVVISGERGPFLWGMINLFICFMVKSKNVIRVVLPVILIVIIIYLNIDYIIVELYDIAPKTAEKIYATLYEGDTSGRFDSGNFGDSIYGNSIAQFFSSPLWGSYFRLLKDFSPNGHGAYPHNIFLEMMITMGLVGLLPFCYFIFKIFRDIWKMKVITLPMIGCLALFLSEFLGLMTSGTIVLNINFWFFFYIMCVLPQYMNKYKKAY